MATQIKKTSTIKQATVTATRNSYTSNQAATPTMMTMSSRSRAVDPQNIRATININVDNYGRLDTTDINLGILGDNKVTSLIFKTSNIEGVYEGGFDDYEVKLFIFNKQKPKGINNPIAITPTLFNSESSEFILENSFFDGGGIYEFIYTLIEKTVEGNIINEEQEIFISDVLTGTLTDSGIPGNFMDLINNVSTTTIESVPSEYIQKPIFEIQLENNNLTTVGNTNLNKLDAYTTPIVLTLHQTGLDAQTTQQYVVYKTAKNIVGAFEFNVEAAGNKLAYIPKEWGYTSGDIAAWVVVTLDDIVYVTNQLTFTVKDNFLSATDLETSVYDSNSKSIQTVDDKTTVTKQSIGGYHKIKYTGAQLDYLLDYVADLYENTTIEAITRLQNDVEDLKANKNTDPGTFRSYAYQSAAPYYVQLDGNGKIVKNIDESYFDYIRFHYPDDWEDRETDIENLYEYFRIWVFQMGSYMVKVDGEINWYSNGPQTLTALFIPRNVNNSNLYQIGLLFDFPTPLDSFKIEMLGGYNSAAECTMFITAYTKDVKTYTRQLCCVHDSQGCRYTDGGWQCIEDRLANIEQSIQDNITSITTAMEDEY